MCGQRACAQERPVAGMALRSGGRDDLGVGTPEQWRAVGIDGRRVACGRATGRGVAPAVAGDA